MLGALALIVLAGVGAGVLGSMLGLGGAILLVPIVNLWLGYPMFTAATVGLVTVIGTSIGVSASSRGRRFLNVKLGLLLLLTSVTGALAGVHAVRLFITERAAELTYGVTAILIAAVMLQRLDKRNIVRSPPPGQRVLDGSFEEPGAGYLVWYRVRRVPVALGAAFVSGAVSSIAGVGAGMVVVPVLNAWCGVPMRVAAITSAFTIGITAVPGLIGHYRLGHLTTPELAAGSVLGVMVGARLGMWLSLRSPTRRLKLLMAGLLVTVGALYLFRSGS